MKRVPLFTHITLYELCVRHFSSQEVEFLTPKEAIMDPATIATLTGSVLSVITPYVVKGADEFAKLVGETAFEKAKGLFAALKHKLSGDPEAADTLAHFDENSQRTPPQLHHLL